MLEILEIKEAERDTWDREVAGLPNVHPLNAFGWGRVRRVDGWTPCPLLARREGRTVGAMLLLLKGIPLPGCSVAYAPRGPVGDPWDRDLMRGLIEAAAERARRRQALFLRMDPHVLQETLARRGDPFEALGLVHLPWRWSYWNTPADVYRIDLTRAKTEAALFNSLDRQARKAVRRAEKLGVVIRQGRAFTDLQTFYGIFRTFSREKGFLARGFAYQKALWEEYVARGNGALFLAEHEGRPIGGLLCITFAGMCLAMHMGTPHADQHLRSNDAYVWEGIRWAWAGGCRWFSFRGVGSSAAETRFKQKFGPRAVPLAGYYDLPLAPLLHRPLLASEFQALPWAIQNAMTLLGRLREGAGKGQARDGEPVEEKEGQAEKA